MVDRIDHGFAEGRDKPEEKDYIDFFEDIEKSVFGAAQSLGYSFGDLLRQE